MGLTNGGFRRSDHVDWTKWTLRNLGVRLWFAGLILRLNRQLIEMGSSTGLLVWGVATIMVTWTEGHPAPWHTPTEATLAGVIGVLVGGGGVLCLLFARQRTRCSAMVTVLQGALWAALAGLVLVPQVPGMHNFAFGLVLYVVSGAVAIRAGIHLGGR